MPRTRFRVGALLLALTIGSLGCSESPAAPTADDAALSYGASPPAELTLGVYTQNMYLGGDTGPLFTLDFGNIPAVIAETSTFWQDVLASGAPSRVAEIVDEIARRDPHVVTLQEALRFVVLDTGFQPTGGLDFLALVEAEIAARGLPYETAVVHEATSATLPMGFDPSTGGISAWLNFTDRLVTLRRIDTELLGTDHGAYAAAIPLGPLSVERGWSRTSIRLLGVPFHVFNTHLETQAVPPVQAAQAAELLGAVVADLDGVTVLAGDLNSNAATSAGDPTWTPTYDNAIAAGFTDVWTASPRSGSGAGLTCCHDPSLTGESDFHQRIDFVLARPSGGEFGRSTPRGAFRAEIVGEEAGDETAAGLWPSDHAGLWSAISTRWARNHTRAR